MNREVILRRLAFIRYLFNVAVEQSKQAEPLAAASILSFHDSVELFMQLASEHLNLGKKEVHFMEYFDLLKLPNGQSLSEKESIRRLNNARVTLKHDGILPPKFEIDALRASVTSFLETNTLFVFGFEFRSVSMLNLVQCKETRMSLEEADKLIKENKLEDALDKIAVAFNQLIEDYENRKRTRFDRSPFFFGKSLTFVDSSFRPLGDDLERAVRDVTSTIGEIQIALKLLSLGLDYRRYAKFRLLTPYVRTIPGGAPHVQRFRREKPTSQEDCRFCYDFVIESSLHLQEFDFDVESEHG